MYEKQELQACESTVDKAEDFTKTFYRELLNFNLSKQNEILRYLHEKTKEERAQRISELKNELEIFEVALKELN